MVQNEAQVVETTVRVVVKLSEDWSTTKLSKLKTALNFAGNTTTSFKMSRAARALTVVGPPSPLAVHTSERHFV